MAITMTLEDIEGIQNLIGRMRRENQALRMAAKDALDILEAENNNRPVNRIAGSIRYRLTKILSYFNIALPVGGAFIVLKSIYGVNGRNFHVNVK